MKRLRVIWRCICSSSESWSPSCMDGTAGPHGAGGPSAPPRSSIIWTSQPTPGGLKISGSFSSACGRMWLSLRGREFWAVPPRDASPCGGGPTPKLSTRSRTAPTGSGIFWGMRNWRSGMAAGLWCVSGSHLTTTITSTTFAAGRSQGPTT